MAGHRATKGKRVQRSRPAAGTRRRLYGELVPLALSSGAPIRLGQSTAEVLEECLARAVAAMRFAGAKLDDLDLAEDKDFWRNTIAGKTPHEWFRLERECRAEVADLAFGMERLGLVERKVRVEEARAALVVQAIKEAAREVGVPAEQVRALGPALRSKMQAMEAAAA